MKASQNQLQDLLQLGGLDQAIRIQIVGANGVVAELKKLDASGDLIDASSVLLDVTNTLENLKSELARVDADLKVVEERIRKDQQRMEQSSNAKDINGLQSELAVLARRKSELEDSELEIMEQISEVEKSVSSAAEDRVFLETQIQAKREALKAELAKYQVTVDELKLKRVSLAAQLPSELIAVYDQKATRGVAIGRLDGRECGACRMALTAANFDELTHAPADDVVFCPECQAILVR